MALIPRVRHLLPNVPHSKLLSNFSRLLTNGMFGWNDFGIDGKWWEENKRENSWEMCLVGRWRERENSWGPTIFSLGPPNYNLSKIEWKQERKLLCIWKRIFGLWCSATRSSFIFFPSPLHLLPLFTLDFFSSSFIFLIFS